MIVDAVFPDEGWRVALCELAQGAGAVFWGFWLEADASAIRQRIEARNAGAGPMPPMQMWQWPKRR